MFNVQFVKRVFRYIVPCVFSFNLFIICIYTIDYQIISKLTNKLVASSKATHSIFVYYDMNVLSTFNSWNFFINFIDCYCLSYSVVLTVEYLSKN